LAGRTSQPKPSPIPTRIGGFGGVEGLIDYLASENINTVVDATHPYAEQISANAAIACASARVPLLVLTRPPWPRRVGDRWIEVENIDDAVDALGAEPRKVFLTHGRLQLAAFARAPQHTYFVRSIDPPAEFEALPTAKLLLSRGPFALDDEEQLMRDEGVEILVTKNSGGDATYAKIEAARRLGINVVVIKRPVAANSATSMSVDDALAWIESHRPAP
jgi:precorrin-6A/cobalt-precorrin-6A reductase